MSFNAHRSCVRIFGILLVLLVAAGQAEDRLPTIAIEPGYAGPYRVTMIRVIDGWRFNLRWQEGPSTRGDGRFHLSDVHTPSATSTDPPCERRIGIAVRDFVRRYTRGKQLKVRDVREGREPESWVGHLQVGDQDLSTMLLDMDLAVPYYDSERNPALRQWNCSKNAAVWDGLQRAGVKTPDLSHQRDIHVVSDSDWRAGTAR